MNFHVDLLIEMADYEETFEPMDSPWVLKNRKLFLSSTHEPSDRNIEICGTYYVHNILI
jgi:hypothetical protein